MVGRPPEWPEKFEVSDRGCWLYKGRLNSSGYGPHRRVYEQFVGPIPTGRVLDHFYCQTRSCINPQHLEPVTYSTNNSRALTKWDVCNNGHERTEKNTYWNKRGKPMCRTCRAANARALRERRAKQ